MMPMRPMRWWDIPNVATLEAQLFEEAWTTEQFWSELAQPTRAYIVAEDDQIIGYGGVYLLPPDSDIQTIAVAPGAQGQGIGSAILDELMSIARDRGCTSMMLEVRSDNEAAMSVYQSRGFEPLSHRRDYYAPGVDAIVMRCRPLRGSDEQ
jgi:ribosomal-protein-alanine N-acetyltransferase